MERSYEIHIRGLPDDDVLRDLPNVVAGRPQLRTVLYGHRLDQAALRGLLNQLEALGLELVEVRERHRICRRKTELAMSEQHYEIAVSGRLGPVVRGALGQLRVKTNGLTWVVELVTPTRTPCGTPSAC